MELRDKKLALVRGDVVIWGMDVAKAKHWARPVRPDGTAAGKAIVIDNKRSGFRALVQATEEVMRREGASRTVVAMEPTGSYWRSSAHWRKDAGHTVVLVNPFHVKQEKERSDNTPSKSDRKDCRIIAERREGCREEGHEGARIERPGERRGHQRRHHGAARCASVTA